MSFQEKRSVVYFLNTCLFFYLYYTNVALNPDAWSFLSVPTDLKFWGRLVLAYIGVQIVANIAVHIIFSIINTVATNEDEPSITDEFDRLVNLKAMRNSSLVFIIGFLLSLVSLTLGAPLEYMFHIQLYALGLTGITAELTEFYFYRWGM